ncbi:MAG TPA: hypothetical protein VFS43_22735 [Polyangiaceae bacterium]|nr:hypothetical protein [Polyangiaceae bacterium]
MRLREELPGDHAYDLILLSVPHYRFAAAAAFLGPRAGDATVLVFNNFWAEPEAAAAPLPAGQLAWGFPRAGGGFQPDGTLRGALLGRVLLGTFGTAPGARERAVREAFRGAGFAVDETRDLRGWLLRHFAVNSGLHLEALKAGGIRALMASRAHREAIAHNVRELFPVLRARGVEPGGEVAPARLPPWLVGALLGAAPALSPPLRAVLEGHANPDEVRAYCRDVLAEARRLGVAVPRLEAGEALFRA